MDIKMSSFIKGCCNKMSDLEKPLQLRRCSPIIIWNNFHISLERIFLNLRGLMWGIVLNDSELVLSFLIQNNMKVGQKVAFRISRFKKQHFFCQQSFVNCQLFNFGQSSSLEFCVDSFSMQTMACILAKLVTLLC